jgi:hypothetical protein
MHDVSLEKILYRVLEPKREDGDHKKRDPSMSEDWVGTEGSSVTMDQ